MRLLQFREGNISAVKRLTRTWIETLEATIKSQYKKIGRELLQQYIRDLRTAYRAEASYDFRSFLIMMEWERKEEDKFYKPRKKFLDPLIDSLQELADGKLEKVGISMPPRVGKTTLGLFYLVWLAGRRPDKGLFAVGHSTPLVASFYDGTYEFATSAEYTYAEIFPESPVVATHAKDLMLDFGQEKRYKTLSFRSLDQKMSGVIDASGLLYVDDIISNFEQASNPDVLAKACTKYAADVKQRMKDNVPTLLIGTRWSLRDPIGVEMENNRDNPKAKFHVLPALDEHGNSNFNFPYNGFSTRYYRERKRELDMIDASLFASIYQQQPMEAEGVCFNRHELQRFNGELPTTSTGEPLEPKTVKMYIDVAWGGGDSLSAPIGMTYELENGEEPTFLKDWVFSRDGKDITIPQIIEKIISNKVTYVKVEANNGGDEYAQEISNRLRQIGYRCQVTWERASTKQSKINKILQYAPDIKQNFYFLADENQGKQYRAAFDELTTWLVTGKSAHDDAPDGLAGLSDMIYGKNMGVVNLMQGRYGL